MTKPTDYNQREMAAGRLTAAHIADFVRHFQRDHGLVADGKAGPLTLAALEQRVDKWGWLHGPSIENLPSDPSWYGMPMEQLCPLAIVAHYTATDPGTARSMALRRCRVYSPTLRLSSWHITIAADGAVYQMVPLLHRAWHVASDQPVAPGLPRANHCAIGIELEGHGEHFPDAQVEAAKRVWRALVTAFKIPRELAMIEHSALQANRSDPGPVWMREHASAVLDAAYR
jgi:N-acetyl-anhydromuramyl-L-alanine amidase AmpD